MVPDGCVHMRLNGLLAVARRLDIDCVPAVIGWNHCRGGSHPMLVIPNFEVFVVLFPKSVRGTVYGGAYWQLERPKRITFS